LASCVTDHQEEKEDLETRMQALKVEMRDLDLEHEREREELASSTCSSGPDVADVARKAARSDTNDAVVQELVNSIHTAIDDLRDRSSVFRVAAARPSRYPYASRFLARSPSLAIHLGVSLPVSESCLSPHIILVQLSFVDPSHFAYRLVLFRTCFLRSTLLFQMMWFF